MKAVKNDLNFFKAYKLGPGKHAEKGMGGIITLICIFILVVAVGFAIPFTMKIQMKKQAEEIREELANPEVAALQEELNIANTKNGLLMAYLGALNSAKQDFDKSKIFDSELFAALADSMPASTTVTSLSLSPQTLQLSCSANDRLAPAQQTQALTQKGLFSSITYDGVVMAEQGVYTFTMNCVFGEEADAE